MKPRSYQIISRAVFEGIDFGWGLAHKHAETPDPEMVKSKIQDAIMSELCGVFTFDELGENQ